MIPASKIFNVEGIFVDSVKLSRAARERDKPFLLSNNLHYMEPKVRDSWGWVADLDTGLWLVESDHVTWVVIGDVRPGIIFLV